MTGIISVLTWFDSFSLSCSKLSSHNIFLNTNNWRSTHKEQSIYDWCRWKYYHLLNCRSGEGRGSYNCKLKRSLLVANTKFGFPALPQFSSTTIVGSGIVHYWIAISISRYIFLQNFNSSILEFMGTLKNPNIKGLQGHFLLFCTFPVQHLRVSEFSLAAWTNLHLKKHGILHKVARCHQILVGYKSPTADGTDVSIWIRSLNGAINEALGHIYPVLLVKESKCDVTTKRPWQYGVEITFHNT